MIRIQFNDNLSMQTVKFKEISPDVVQLSGDKIPKSNAGFKAYRLNGNLLGDYSDYTNIISEDKNCIQYGKQQKTEDAYTKI